jgi:plastocyanin
LAFVAAVGIAAGAASAVADEPVQSTIVIKDHKFEPAELRVPAGKRVTLTVDNQDATPEEFESKTLRVEKVVPGGKTGVVRFGPLVAGTYDFIGEFHQDSAKGKVIAE